MKTSHGVLGLVSQGVPDGEVPVKAVRYSEDPEDGWWILAEQDLPLPEVERVMSVCIHCVVDTLGPEVARGMDAALADSRTSGLGIGFAAWDGGRWVTGEAGWMLVVAD